MVQWSLALKWPIQVHFCGMDHQKSNFLLILAPFLSEAAEDSRCYFFENWFMKLKIYYLLKPLGTITQQNYWSFYPSEQKCLRADLICTLHYETPCIFVHLFFWRWDKNSTSFWDLVTFTKRKLRQFVTIETYLLWVWGRYSLTLLILWIVTITCSRNWSWTCGNAAIREKFFEGCLGTTSWMFWSPFLIPFVLWKIKEKQPWLVWPLTSWHLSKGYVLEGASKKSCNFETTLFVDIEIRKCTSK